MADIRQQIPDEAIKPGSTAAVATDPALVVAISPNNTVGVTGAYPANVAATGTFTATDAVVAAPIGDGTLVSGASTAGSVIAVAIPDAIVAWTLLIKNYASGTIYSEASTNSTNGTDGDWVEIKGRRTGTLPGIEAISYLFTSSGYYRGNAAGFRWIRARLITSGTIGGTISWMLSYGLGATFLNSGLPQGTSTIGFVGSADAIGNKGVLTNRGEINVTGASLDTIATLLVQILMEAKKQSLILAQIGNVVIDDSEVPTEQLFN